MDTPDQATFKADILIADDTPENLRLLSEMLETQGYRVRAVTSGKRALGSVQAALPDLILLDIMMPDMNGYEVAHELQKDQRTNHVPIIFISALSDIKDKVNAFTAGGVDYISKPFQLEEVLARVETHLKLRALQRQLEQRVQELEQALKQVRLLSGLLPICANCKKIRDDQGYWHQVEVYIRDHSEANFSHGLCPDCVRELYPDFADSDEP